MLVLARKPLQVLFVGDMEIRLLKLLSAEKVAVSITGPDIQIKELQLQLREDVRIGGVTFAVLAIGPHRIKIGVRAPKSVAILRDNAKVRHAA